MNEKDYLATLLKENATIKKLDSFVAMAIEYEAFISWIEIQCGLALKGKLYHRLALKQIKARINHPDCTQLGLARILYKSKQNKIETERA